MEIVLLGGFHFLPNKLKEKGHTVHVPDGENVQSLTALLLKRPDISAMVISEAKLPTWSDGHILAAAKMLQARGRFVIVGSGTAVERLKSSPLVILTEDEETALKLLLRPKGGAAALAAKKDSGGGPPLEREKRYDIAPLEISKGRILMIDVVGSQPRIGCTTQAIALWHYFKVLGMDPAVVMPESQLRLMAETMQGVKRIKDEYVIQKIPFVPDTQRSYDCYIRDLGFGYQIDHKKADAILLVAGAKPWELVNTIQAARQMASRKTAMVLSFATKQNRNELAQVFRDIQVTEVPYIPDPWEFPVAMLMVFNNLLRPILQREETEEQQCLEKDLQEIS